jgi:hypothetical protein
MSITYRPNQVVPTFSSVYLSVDQTLPGVWTVILFDIIETDGVDLNIYNRLTGEFTAPESAWFDVMVNLQTSALLSGIRVVKNGDINFPIIGRVPDGINVELFVRIKLGAGETVRVEGLGAVDILATSGLVPNTRASNAVFTMIKRFQDTRPF